ncbi:MAG: hypothetical protein ACRDU5_00745 [Mycobacterium sp.]
MAELVRDETASVRFDVRPGDARGALKALVDEYERMGDLNIRMLTSALDVERLAEILGMARRSHRLWIETVFANSLPSPKKARERAINSIYAATDVYVWKLLRRDLGLSRDETQRVMTDLVLGVINARRP